MIIKNVKMNIHNIVEYIFNFLDGNSLHICAQVDKLFYSILKNDNIWKKTKYGTNTIEEYAMSRFFFKQSTYRDTFILCKKIDILKKKISLSSDFYDIPYFAEIEIYHRNLNTLPNEIGLLTNLQRLRVSSSCIKYLPETFDKLINLEELYLSVNDFEIIPSVLCKLPKLKKLDLQHNKITYISESLYDLKKLEVLNLSHNNITHMSDGISKMNNLIKLMIGNNLLTNLPADICQIINLQFIDLDYDKILNVQLADLLDPRVAELLKNKKIIHMQQYS